MNNFDFVTNLYPRTFPYGISVEAFRAKTFSDNYPMLETIEQHEHITSFFYKYAERFNYKNFTSVKTLNEEIRLVVDSQEDLPIIEKILKNPEIISSPNLETIIRILND
jgi:spore coat polysaccharide biosynthesis protein SpsF (cytidylyltransferase family)